MAKTTSQKGVTCCCSQSPGVTFGATAKSLSSRSRRSQAWTSAPVLTKIGRMKRIASEAMATSTPG